MPTEIQEEILESPAATVATDSGNANSEVKVGESQEDFKEKIFEYEQRIKNYEKKNDSIRQRETELSKMVELDNYLKGHPEMSEAVENILLGGARRQEGSLDESDPLAKRLAKLEMENRRLMETTASSRKQDESRRQAAEIRSEVESLSEKYDFLKNDSHKRAVLAMYSFSGNDKSLFDVVKEYSSGMSGYKDSVIKSYLESKKRPSIEGKAGAAVITHPSTPKGKIGSEEQKQNLENSLTRILNERGD
jgi:hypothetical protein